MSILSLDKAKNLQINAAGYNITLAQGVTLPPRSHESVAAMQAVIEEIEKNPQGLTAEIKNKLKSSIKQLEALGANPKNIGLIEKALAYAPAEGATAEVITAGLMKNPLARKMLSVEELGNFGIAGDKIAELDKRIAARGEIAFLIEKHKQLDKLDDDGLKKLQSIFSDHYRAPEARGNLTEVEKALTDLEGHESSLLEARNKTYVLIDAGKQKFETAAQALKTIDDEIIAAKVNGDTVEAIKALENKKIPHATAIFEATDSKLPYAGKILEEMKKKDPKLFETAKSATKDLGSHMDSTLKAAKQATEGGAKKGGGFFGFFKHSEESLADLSKSKGKTLTELGKKVGDVRWGRAAMVGLPIAAIGAYFLAGTGNKPGKHTEAAMAQQQGAEPAMGR